MILIALGANLPSRFGTPADTLKAAEGELEACGVNIVASSRIWLSAPVPFDPAQDWYHNSVVAVETGLPAHDLLDLMLSIEAKFGRIRSVKNAPRLLDLDLIAYHDDVIKDNELLIVPHARMHERLFVLNPLGDISNSWVHPVLGQDVTEMIQNLPKGQEAKPLEGMA